MPVSLPVEQDMIERRSCVRHKVQGPVFASFDGVTGGFILDVSEAGMGMQAAVPVEAHRRVQLQMNLQDSQYVETTGYVAWADALGRAGVRFSELPEEARQRLDQWLSANAGTPSRKAPKMALSAQPAVHPAVTDGAVDPPRGTRVPGAALGTAVAEPWAVSLELAATSREIKSNQPGTTVEYEFRSLGSDLPGALRLICERARTLTRGNGAVIALGRKGYILCRASVGACAPPVGARVDVNSGFSGECVRTGKALRCDDTDSDPLVDAVICRKLGIRSIVAAPIQYEREIVGLLEVFSERPFAFEESDMTLVERLSQTVLLTVSQMAAL